ncbi:hypothetical protein Bbelb_425170 [Branchiostoma belcheri]|nr:hypothetical protein Bbelb_425170 [Branchiostoma belcheri]
MKKGRVAVEGQSEGLTVLLSSFKRNRSSLLPMKETRRSAAKILENGANKTSRHRKLNEILHWGESDADKVKRYVLKKKAQLIRDSKNTINKHETNKSWAR